MHVLAGDLSECQKPGGRCQRDILGKGEVAQRRLRGALADAEFAHHRAPGLPRLELAGVLPQRRGGDGGAVALRLANSALGGVAGGLPRFACEPPLFSSFGVERVEIGTAVAIDLVLAPAPTPALAAAACSLRAGLFAL